MRAYLSQKRIELALLGGREIPLHARTRHGDREERPRRQEQPSALQRADVPSKLDGIFFLSHAIAANA